MNVALPPALRRFVEEQVKTGRYLDAGDVVREAVRRMELTPGVNYKNLAGMGDGDIMALAFIVIMEAAKSAREDLKAIMDGVKAINKEKEAWRAVADTINRYRAAAAAKPDDFAAEKMPTIPKGPRKNLRGKPAGAATLDGHALAFNIADSNSAIVSGGFVVQGTGSRGIVTKADIDSAKEAVKNKLDSLSEMGEMESLRLQMAMDRMSKMMSTLSNLLKKVSETAQSVTQNLK